MDFIRYIAVIILTGSFHLMPCIAQIYSPEADSVLVTDYKIDGERDSIYVFYKQEGGNGPYSVIAQDSSISLADFTWEIYNPATKTYDLLGSETGTASSSIDTITSNNGYRVIIDTSGVKDTVSFWTFINDFSVKINNDTVPDNNSNCDQITNIKASIDSNTYIYYSPEGNPIKLDPDYKIDWTADIEEAAQGSFYFSLDNKGLKIIITKPHWENTNYIIEVTDISGLVRRDSIYYESIIPHADFEKGTYINLDNRNYYPDKPERYYEIYNSSLYDAKSVPALYEFTNKSANADNFTWKFGDSTSYVSELPDEKVTHTYQYVGEFLPILIAEKNVDGFLFCRDTFPKGEDTTEYFIETDVPTLEVMNVFSPPNGDTKYFRFKDASITDFEIVIFNRYGNKVYKYEGNIRNWEGWDGRFKNSGHYVPTGVYYYVVKDIRKRPFFNEDELTEQEKEEADLNSKYKGNENVNIHRGFLHVFNTE